MVPRCVNEWLESLENRHSQEIQLGLDRIRIVAQKLKLQRPDCKVITIAGTNGKGSTVAALERIYHTAGYRVGAYTSPHLIEFNERIRVNRSPISDEDLCAAFSIIEASRGNTALSYFEMTTLAALWYFKQSNLDIILLEVGLGGRLDATNCIDSDVSIITTIDLDHQEFLGTTLEAIGQEKAGILREGKPFIYADVSPPASIIETSLRLQCPSYLYAVDYHIEEEGNAWGFQSHDIIFKQLPKPSIQLKAAAAAIMASCILAKDLPISPAHLYLAMEQVFIAGRLQLHAGDVRILYDVAHNPQSARLLAQRVSQIKNTGKVHAIFSALKDKDILGLILPLKYCVNRWYPAQLEGKRAAKPSQLLSSFEEAEITTQTCYNSPFVAFETAMKEAQIGDLIIVYGSFLTVSHVMTHHNLSEQRGTNETGIG